MVTFTADFQKAFGSAANFTNFINFCDASQLLERMLAKFTGTVDLTRDLNGAPLPHGGTSSNNILISFDPYTLPYNSSGQPQSSGLSYALLATALAHELGHQLLPNGNNTGLFKASTVSAAITAGEQSEGAAFTAEYVVAQQLVDAGVANKPLADGGLVDLWTGATVTRSDLRDSSGDLGLLFWARATNTNLDALTLPSAVRPALQIPFLRSGLLPTSGATRNQNGYVGALNHPRERRQTRLPGMADGVSGLLGEI